MKSADVFSANVKMRMMATLGGGSKDRLEISFISLLNENSSYPIQGVQETFPGVSYRTSSKGWMDSDCWRVGQ